MGWYGVVCCEIRRCAWKWCVVIPHRFLPVHSLSLPVPCCAMPCHILCRTIGPYHTVLYNAVLYRASLCCAVPCRVLCRAIHYRNVSYCTLPSCTGQDRSGPDRTGATIRCALHTLIYEYTLHTTPFINNTLYTLHSTLLTIYHTI